VARAPLVEQRYDAQKTVRYFEASNQLYAARSASTTRESSS